MRTEPSISPLTLSICCAVVAGALALAPGRDAGPMGFLRGGDVVAMEAESMDPGAIGAGEGDDQAVAAGVELEVPTDGRVGPPPAEAVAPACGDDCVEEPGPTGRDSSGTTSNGGPTGSVDGEGPGGSDDVQGTDASPADTTGTPDGADGAEGDDSCRSRRAVAARQDGPADVVRPSPCSQGRGEEPCEASSCDDRSRGTRQA